MLKCVLERKQPTHNGLNFGGLSKPRKKGKVLTKEVTELLKKQLGV